VDQALDAGLYFGERAERRQLGDTDGDVLADAILLGELAPRLGLEGFMLRAILRVSRSTDNT
jgi:hypothetical protein